MSHTVEIIADSVSSIVPYKRITTYRLRYARMIHAELLTHRVMSRNASSSRAIPVDKMLAWSTDDTYVPIFRKNKPGMQPGDFLSPEDQAHAEEIWKKAAEFCMCQAHELSALGVHKQWANRMLEWFGYINVQVTSTEWNNFFALRTELNEDGMPVPQDEIYHLAVEMKRQRDLSTPQVLQPGEWHLPWVTQEEKDQFSHEDQIALSIARSASVSYKTVDGKIMTPDRALELNRKLLASHPIHASPAEHQATPDRSYDRYGELGVWEGWENPHLHGNFDGWIQYRKTLDGENLEHR